MRVRELFAHGLVVSTLKKTNLTHVFRSLAHCLGSDFYVDSTLRDAVILQLVQLYLGDVR